VLIAEEGFDGESVLIYFHFDGSTAVLPENFDTKFADTFFPGGKDLGRFAKIGLATNHRRRLGACDEVERAREILSVLTFY